MSACVTTTLTRRPPVDLATFLDEGGDLADFPLLESLTEAILLERPRQSEPERRMVAGWCREQVTAWLERRPSCEGISFLPRNRALMTALLWQADCLEDPELAARFEAALPLPLRAKCAWTRPGQGGERLRRCVPA